MKILVIDDDKTVTDLIAAFLKKEGYDVAMAYSAQEGLQKTRNFGPDVVLLDIRLHEDSGLKLLPELLLEQAGASVIMMTSYPSTQSVVEAMNLGAVNYLEKPIDFAKLKDLLKSHAGFLPGGVA